MASQTSLLKINSTIKYRCVWMNERAAGASFCLLVLRDCGFDVFMPLQSISISLVNSFSLPVWPTELSGFVELYLPCSLKPLQSLGEAE